MANDKWMLIGRQEVTSFGARIDLLAITPDGSLVLIELKRDRTPREVIAQDRGRYTKPSLPRHAARPRHRHTVGFDTPTSWAIAEVVMP